MGVRGQQVEDPPPPGRSPGLALRLCLTLPLQGAIPSFPKWDNYSRPIHFTACWATEEKPPTGKR